MNDFIQDACLLLGVFIGIAIGIALISVFSYYLALFVDFLINRYFGR